MSERKLFASEIAERLDGLLLASLRQRSLARPAAALEALPRAAQERVLHWVGVAAQSAADLGAALAEEAATVDAAGVDAWARSGLAAYDAGGIEAARNAWRAAHQATAGVEFAAVEARLTQFAHGLAGRPLPLRSGPTPHTDGEALWLPPRAASERHYLAAIALLWAQLAHGSFAVDLDAALPPAWPRERSLAWLAVLEALRLEACLGAELPGLARELAALRGPLPAALMAAAADLARPAAGIADSLRWLAQVGADEPPLWPHVGVLDPAAVRARRAAPASGAGQAGRQAPNVLRGVGGAGPDNPDTPPLAADSAPQGFDPNADLISLPAAPAPETAAKVSLDDTPPQALVAAGPGAWQPLDAPGAQSQLAVAAAPDALLDEWDYRRGAYRRQWCHVYENEVAPGDAEWVKAARMRHAHLIRRVRRRFESLRGEDRVLRRQLDGEDIDLDALVAAHADRKGGAEPSSRVFAQRQRDQRSLAVMLMIDMSGSTKGWVNDAEREALVLLCEAIEALGDAYAIYGFSGWTRTRCDIYRVKRFAERYDDAVRQRIAGIEAKDYTRMGVAVRHLSGLLAAQPARHKLLVCLSDGRPDDYGDEYRGHYGVEDTRRALQEARAEGIRSFCVTIDRHGADYLPRLYGPAHYAVIDDARKLPEKLADIYRKITQ